MPRVFIGIGSNIDRERNVRAAVGRLKETGTGIVISPVYESRAYGFEGGNFYNLAIGMETDIPPESLTGILRDIEDGQGRLRDGPKYSSRTLDLDLLIYGDLVRHDETLNVPRRDIMSCSFVLRPLADIAGEFRHPESGARIIDIWRAFDRPDQELWKVEFEL